MRRVVKEDDVTHLCERIAESRTVAKRLLDGVTTEVERTQASYQFPALDHH